MTKEELRQLRDGICIQPAPARQEIVLTTTQQRETGPTCSSPTEAVVLDPSKIRPPQADVFTDTIDNGTGANQTILLGTLAGQEGQGPKYGFAAGSAIDQPLMIDSGPNGTGGANLQNISRFNEMVSSKTVVVDRIEIVTPAANAAQRAEPLSFFALNENADTCGNAGPVQYSNSLDNMVVFTGKFIFGDRWGYKYISLAASTGANAVTMNMYIGARDLAGNFE